MTLKELEERLQNIHDDMHADEPQQENLEPCMCPMSILLGELYAAGVQVPITLAGDGESARALSESLVSCLARLDRIARG
jgi:hypothetical protein